MLPQKIKDRYITKRWLGSGAYGDVYEMWDTLLEKSFAVKVVDIRHTNKESVLREARCLMDLHHPHIIRFHTCEVYEESLLIFTELLQAESLYDHIQKNHNAIERSFHHYAVKILNAVKYIHDQGIVHGDLKTGNILLTGADGIKIIDFGLASYVSKAELHGGRGAGGYHPLADAAPPGRGPLHKLLALADNELRTAGRDQEGPGGGPAFPDHQGNYPAGQILPGQAAVRLPHQDRI